MNKANGERRKTYSAAVIDGLKRNSTIYVGDSIAGTSNLVQVTGQIATLQWSRGPDNVEHVNEG